MSDGIQGAIILGVLLWGIANIIKTFTDYRLRRKLIEMGQVDEKVSHILASRQDTYYNALKWGMIILFGGLGLIVLEFVEYDADSPFPFGVEAVFVAAGFLLYYYMVRRDVSKI